MGAGKTFYRKVGSVKTRARGDGARHLPSAAPPLARPLAVIRALFAPRAPRKTRVPFPLSSLAGRARPGTAGPSISMTDPVSSALASLSPRRGPPLEPCNAQLCKYMPTLMEMYKLDELTTIRTLQDNVKNMFYKNSRYTDPDVSAGARPPVVGPFPASLGRLTLPQTLSLSLFGSALRAQMIKVMVHKGDEELQLLLKMHKQRHHVITKYVVMHDPFKTKQPPSGFMAQFYASN